MAGKSNRTLNFHINKKLFLRSTRRTFIKQIVGSTALISAAPYMDIQAILPENIRQKTSGTNQGPFDVRWIHGSEKCEENTDPPFQVHQFDPDTYILRQNKCLTYEAPFLYLLFGDNKAILLDSGDRPSAGPLNAIRLIINKTINTWLANRKQNSIDLVIAHTHGHFDHTFGDSQFIDREHTFMVAPHQKAVQRFFGIEKWAESIVPFDLGKRVLSIIPTPGHTDDHIAIYDEKTRLLFSGDTLYPGNLYVRYWHEYKSSIDRLLNFTLNHEVSYILGNHIEMSSTPGKLYPIGSRYQPNEHVLQLELKHLIELRDMCTAMGETLQYKVHDDFILVPRG